MTDFWAERSIKSTRKPHRCEWCRKVIPAGNPAVRSSGVFDGEFQYRIAHTDCEAAVTEYHKICNSSYDELNDMSDIVGDRDNWPWLLEEYPAVAERVGLAERIEEERRCLTKT